MTDVASSAKGLSVHIAARNPVRLDVAFEVAAGELVALLGPSGSGKSSTLRAIAGLLTPESGAIACGGEVWFKQELDAAARVNIVPQQRRVGLVFQDYALFPHLSARDNIAIAVPNGDDPAITSALLDQFRLTPAAGRRPAQLSGGERQRVAIARALARGPRVLLLDEPFSAVDRAVRDVLKAELANLRGRIDIPIVLVTHDLNEALALADRIAVLIDGRLVQIGAPQDVRANPANAIAARLLGQPNVFKAKVFAPSRGGASGLLSWGRVQLAVADTGAAAGGDAVTWMVPSDDVLLYHEAPPPEPDGPRITHVRCRITAIQRLAEVCVLSLMPYGAPDDTLALTLTPPALSLMGLREDRDVHVGLPADAIRVLAAD